MDIGNSVCNEKVYSRVYAEHATEMRNYAYYKCGDLNKAEDLVHEAFVKLWQKCADISLKTVVGFLVTVIKRLFIDQVRANKMVYNFEQQDDDSVDHEDPHFVLRTKEFNVQLETTIAALPEGQREAFLMNRIDKLSYKEIAERLEISQTAVEKRISKALVKIRIAIKEFKNF